MPINGSANERDYSHALFTHICSCGRERFRARTSTGGPAVVLQRVLLYSYRVLRSPTQMFQLVQVYWYHVKKKKRLDALALLSLKYMGISVQCNSAQARNQSSMHYCW